MRKLFIALFILSSIAANAQLNNSWIDYNKTYYKFKLGKNGVIRLGQTFFANLGLTNTPVEYFQLWRNGEEVRLFTSTPSGPLGASDFVEFWGMRNDGKPDNQLYLKSSYQLCDSFSLHTDTASYFLTVNPAAGNLRYNNAVNNVAGNTLAPDAYFMRTIGLPYKNQYNRGYAVQVGEYVYSASYDIAEGWTTTDIAPCCPYSNTLDNMNVYQAGPPNSVSLHIAAAGNALNTRKLGVNFYNNEVLLTTMNYFDTVKRRIDNLPLSLLPNVQNLFITIRSTSANPTDRIVIANVGVTYPSYFNFNGSKNFSFELAPSAVGNFLEIDNFSTGGVPPVLYSISDGQRYEGDISVAGKVRFALPASSIAVRKFMLFSSEAANIATVSAATTRNFVDYSNPATHGDYLIISNSALYNDGNGVNYVDLYKQYRASTAGGGFNVKVMDIDELTDQFAFGIRQHPGAIRDFIRYAHQQYTPKPQYVMILGRGVTSIDYKKNEANPLVNQLDLVPTFGWPASDVLLACAPGTNIPLIPIGRLSAVNGTEIKHYLDKVIQYENVSQTSCASIDDRAWMKNVIHVVGGADSLEDNQFTNYMDNYKAIIEDSLYGGTVETFRKTSSSAVEQANGERIQQLINNGVGMIGYFGHSSANTLAFNLTTPELFNNEGKYPFFNISGCSAGNFFTFDPLRVAGILSISEKYVLAERRGSIGFLASTHLGIPPFLNFYNTQFYHVIGRDLYGSSIGNQIKRVLENLGSNPATLDFYTRIHLEELNLHGDPAIRLNNFPKPDYAIEESYVKLNPTIVTVADNQFTLKVKFANIGRATSDSIRLLVSRKLSNDSVVVLYSQLIAAPDFADSILLTVPVNPLTDKGLNRITVTLDSDGNVDENCESNNQVVREFYILEDEIRPVSPYNYSIVNQQNIVYSASTANPLMDQRQYLMEIDTTELFNSPFKKQYTNSGSGGIVQFTPNNISFTDSTVYYWRTSMVPLNSGAPVVWNTYSFIYLANSSTGFNQSHYYQHKRSSYSGTIALDDDGIFRYKQVSRNLQIKTGLYPYTSFDRISVTLDFDQFEQYGCKYASLQFLVYDSSTLEPWVNYNVNATNGRFGSWAVCLSPRKIFEFPYGDPVYRKRAMDFLDSIPDGLYVSITNLGWMANTSFIQQWQSDTATLGSGKSLYHKLKSVGFNKIDSFSRNLPFVYFFRKNAPEFTPKTIMGATPNEQVEGNFQVFSRYKTGTIESPAFGPAKTWTALHWRGTSADVLPGDSTIIQVIGIKADGSQQFLTNVRPATDTSLSFINAATYPYVKLKMINNDLVNATPKQLTYWRINADFIPEGAVAPNVLYRMKDTVQQGEKIDFALAFKNISPVAFDSMKIKMVITDHNNVPHAIALPKRKALLSGDTLVVSYQIDTKDYPGLNTLYVMVNPENDQPEQYLYNNFIYKDFYVIEDRTNPLLDVTFDGVHIFNKDLVSSRPHILIKLKDENRFIALADTSLLTVKVRYPNDPAGTYRRFFFGDSMRFTPASLAGGDNTASIDFTPLLPEDGEYELLVSGKDEVGNKAGSIEYKVTFSVITKAMISNMLNYPNPFTTSTAFVFTITGSDVPQNIRIQILTITGKVVREITKNELGNLHIGRNITDFKWDGTDSYGQKLGNGVYLYRVITNNNGKSLDKYKAEGDNSDQFFKAGYGKMYLMR